MSTSFDVEVAVVGGGPAGAAIAAHLVDAGHEVVVLERLPRPVWRASGVYSSPLTRRRLAELGLTNDRLTDLLRPIAAMAIETSDGRTACRLDYPPPNSACGVDRVSLEAALLALIRERGARVYEGAVVRSVEFGRARSRLVVSHADGVKVWNSRLVVGADGPSSVVARAAGVSIGARFFRRAALTGHRSATAGIARLAIGRGWYIGLAPVPRDRVNLGLVMGEARLRQELLDRRPDEIMTAALRRVPAAAALLDATPTDAVVAHLPLVHRVRRTAGDGFLLVGDAAGFVDPLSGEGLHRALVTAELGAHAVGRYLAGAGTTALAEYDQRLRRRFRSKDVLSWALQLFTLEPALARRAIANLDRRPDLRSTFAAALADIVPASSVFDPRFVGRLLA